MFRNADEFLITEYGIVQTNYTPKQNCIPGKFQGCSNELLFVFSRDLTKKVVEYAHQQVVTVEAEVAAINVNGGTLKAARFG